MDVIIIVMYLILLSVGGIIAIFALRRKMKSRILVVRDARNRSLPEERYYLVNDRRVKQLRLYKTLIHPSHTAIMPPTDIKPYIFSDGKMYGYRGVTGHPDDDNIMLLRWPIVGEAMGREYSSTMSDAIQKTLSFFDACKVYHINDEVTFKIGNVEKDGIVTNMGYDGLEITYIIKKANKEGVPEEIEQKSLFRTASQLKEADVKITKAADKDTAVAGKITDFFNVDWVCNNLGIIPIDDANIIYKMQKDFIVEFNSRVSERMDKRKSWLERNQLLVWMVIMTLALAVFFAICAYATQNYVSSIAGHAEVVNNEISAILNATHTLGGA